MESRRDFRVPFPKGGFDPDDIFLFEHAITPALHAMGSCIYAESWDVLPAELTPTQRTLLAIHVCYCEVGNGGFRQYFWNCGCEMAKAALAGFEAAGMDYEAKLLWQAMALVPGGIRSGSRDDVCARIETVDKEKWRQVIDPIEREWYRLNFSTTYEANRQLTAFVLSRRAELFLD